MEKIKCSTCCFAMAKWQHITLDNEENSFCEKHVPRGCSCHSQQEPCCEYIYSESGFVLDE